MTIQEDKIHKYLTDKRSFIILVKENDRLFRKAVT